MKKIATYCVPLLGLLVFATVALAQPAGTGPAAAAAPVVDFSRYFGAGLATFGGAFGIGKLASSALEGMARQPEAAGSIQTAMIIAAALIEGFTFFALVICIAI